jgi:hypothetical protein
MVWARALVLLLLSSAACRADPAFTLDQLEFQGWMARQRQGPATEVYIPLGTGYLFQTPATDDAEQVIGAWVAAHPKAEVIVVDRELATTRLPKVYFSYILVQDGMENLNLTLVRQGIFPAWIMRDPVDAMSGVPRANESDEYYPKRLVTDVAYAVFVKQVLDAEAAARRDRKGIWSWVYQDRRREWHLE